MLITTDDVCPSNLKYFDYWLKVKKKYPELKLIAFTIANNQNRENVSESWKFKAWFEENKDWVKVGIHGYCHTYPPEQERNDAEDLVKKSLEILKPYLPERILYRPPGFQTTIRTEAMIKNLGFAGIAHQTRIKYFDGTYKIPFNTHLTLNKYDRPIGLIWNKIKWEKIL